MKTPRSIFYIILLALVTSCVPQKSSEKQVSASNAPVVDIGTKRKDNPDGYSPKQSQEYISGEILVRFKRNTDKQTIQSIQQKLHLKTLKVFSTPQLYLMKITDDTAVKLVMQRLQKYQAVKYSEPNYVKTIPRSKGVKE